MCICQTTIAIPKKGNVERHFRTVCEKYNTDFPLKSELRKRKVRELKSQLIGLQSIFTQRNSQAKADTEASLRVYHSIIKHKESFQDREMIKEAFVEAADSLFQDFKNKLEILSLIKALKLSTVTLRCNGRGFHTAASERHLQTECFSLQLYESTDTSDTAQLCIFIWIMFTDTTAKEELLTFLPMCYPLFER